MAGHPHREEVTLTNLEQEAVCQENPAFCVDAGDEDEENQSYLSRSGNSLTINFQKNSITIDTHDGGQGHPHLTLTLPDCSGSRSACSSPRPCSPRTPTPRLTGSAIGWRPVMPGYKARESLSGAPGGASLVIQRTVEVNHNSTDDEHTLRDYIPVMPKSVAVVCFVCNVICPGLGTMMSGVSILCCSEPRPAGTTRLGGLWVNSWVALLQLLTTFIFLLGWMWSIIWGLAFISMAEKGKRQKSNSDARGSAEHVDPAAHRFQNQRRADSRAGRTTTTTTVAVHSPDDVTYQDQHPIIVLQEAPIIIHPQEDLQVVAPPPPRPHRTLNPNNPRHQRILRRQNTLEEFPPILLTPETLENIVIHNAPVPGHVTDDAPGSKASPAPMTNRGLD